MIQNLVQTLVMSKPDSLANAFQRLGRLGFLLQIIVAVLILVLSLWVLLPGSSPSVLRANPGISEYIALAGFVVLLFLVTVFFRYQKLGARIPDPETRPPKATVLGVLKQGLMASCLAVVLSLSAMMVEAVRLLIVLLGQSKSPVQAATDDEKTWISAINMASLLADQLILIAALTSLALSLWLLMRISMMSGYERKRKRAEA